MNKKKNKKQILEDKFPFFVIINPPSPAQRFTQSCNLYLKCYFAKHNLFFCFLFTPPRVTCHNFPNDIAPSSLL